jgi:hypothetical protein
MPESRQMIPGRVAAASVAVLLLLLAAPRARADAGFPGSLQIVLPADRPNEIYLATNFGLIISEDGGATWTWTCEQQATNMGYIYVVGPSPADRIFSVPGTGLAYSDDGSCTWQVAGGTLAGAVVADVFPDPSSPSRVIALAEPTSGDASVGGGLFPSDDGGATFKDALFVGPPDGVLASLEIARSDPLTMYVAFYTIDSSAGAFHPQLARSNDGGASWTVLDNSAALGLGMTRILAIDPTDANTVYLRLIQNGSQSVAVTKDAGVTFTTPVTVSGGASAQITAFVRTADGTLLVGASAMDASPIGFRSIDGGVSFQSWSGVPHLTALAERDGKLYAAAHNYTDGWAIGVSTDGGTTFQPLASYNQVTSIKACAQTACLAACQYQASANGTWPAAVCSANASDAGAQPPPNKSGGGCRTATSGQIGGGAGADGAGAGSVALAALLLAMVFAIAKRR